jgi:hypothetical protein
MTPLLRHRGDDLVAFGPEGTKTASDLSADAAKIAAVLPACRPGSHALMVFDSDRYAFAVALLAAWSAGHAVMLPPDGRPSTIAALLEHPDVDCLLHDTRAGGHLQIQSNLDGPAASVLAPRPPPPQLVTTFAGEGRTPLTKTAGQLLGEVEALARSLELPMRSRFVVDVAPTHLHGLVLGILLPLCIGSAFSRDIAPSPEAIARGFERADTWITVPAHLRAAAELAPWPGSSLRRILCCTTRPPDATGREVARACGLRIVELFGPVETGCVAWRAPAEDEAWQPLPGVVTSFDDRDRLHVDAPFLAVAHRPWPTGDRAKVTAKGEFVLFGRTEEIVRTADREMSMVALRSWLLARPDVRDAEATLVHRGDEATLLAAVVGPTCDPERLQAEMTERLGLDGVSRRVVVVDRIERGIDGEASRPMLLRAFGLGSDGSPLTTRLQPDALEDRGEALTTRVRIPEDYVHFEGHFDGHPILAAVVQLHELLLPLAHRARPELGELQTLQQLKFLGRISPGDEVTVSLRFSENADTCDFEILRGTERCSAGRLRFAVREVA